MILINPQNLSNALHGTQYVVVTGSTWQLEGLRGVHWKVRQFFLISSRFK